jgi:hypothetical protein
MPVTPIPQAVTKQLWVAERTDDPPEKKRKIYVYADRWFDVRAFAGMQLEVLGDYNLLFISAVMGDVEFGETPIWEIEWSGSAPNLEKRVVRWHNVTPR